MKSTPKIYINNESFFICASLIFFAITLISGIYYNDKKYLLGALLSGFVLVAVYKSFVLTKSTYPDRIKLVKRVALFNIVIFLLYYLSSFELGVPKYFWRISFDFGNFMDFFTLPETYSSNSFLWISTGHFPFSYAISKFVADISGASPGNISFIRIRNIYFFIFAISLFPVGILVHRFCKINELDSESKFLIFIAIFASYPILMGFERGNFAFIAAALISLVCLAYIKGLKITATLLISVAASIKTINLVFLLFIYSRFGIRHMALALVSLICVESLSLLYLFDLNFAQWKIFIPSIFAPLNSPVVFTDANKIIATTGLEGLRSALNAMIYHLQYDVTTPSKISNLVFIMIGGFSIVYFYAFKRFNCPWYIELIVLVTVPLLFHSSSGDYNLQILVPLLVVVLIHEINSPIVPYLLMPMLLVGGVVISRINCCGEGLERYITLSVKSFLIPYSLAMVLYLILSNKSNDDRKI